MMLRSLASRRLPPAALLLLLASPSAGCRDPQPTYSFDAGTAGAGAGGKGGAGGAASAGTAGRAGTGGIPAGTGGFSGGASGGFSGGGTGGFSGGASGGFTGSATGGLTGGAGAGGGTPSSGSGGTGGGAGSGGTGAGGRPGSGGAAGTGGSTGGGGIGAGGRGGTSAGGSGAAGGAASAGGAGGGGGGQIVLSDAALLAAADFELNSDAAAAAANDCDPTKLSANTTITDANGLSWGPKTLRTQAQQDAFANLIHAIFQSIGTTDAPGPGPGGSAGLHGWPDLTPRLTGVATNPQNNGPGNRAIYGGLQGLGVPPAALTDGTFNGELTTLYKAAAIADGLTDKSGQPLTLASSNAEFGAAIAPITTNQGTAVGLANNVAQCALTISIGVDGEGVVLAHPTTFTHNVVEDL